VERAVELAGTIGNAVLVTIRILSLVQIDPHENLMRELVRGGAADPFAYRPDYARAIGIPRGIGDSQGTERPKADRPDAAAEGHAPRGSGHRQGAARDILDDADSIEARGLSGESKPQTSKRQVELASRD
jgi:hypothetical protein